MAIVVVCPSCGHRAGAKEEWVGKQVKCPGCGGKITVTTPPPPPGPTGAPPRSKVPGSGSPPSQSRAGKAPSPRPAPGARQSPAAQRSQAAAQRPAPTAPPQGGGIFDLLGDVDLSAGDPLGAAIGGPPLGSALGSPALGSNRKKGGSTKTIWIVIGVVGGVVALGCAGLVIVGVVAGIRTARELEAAATQASTSLTNLQPFSPDPALVNQLGPETSFDRYSLRLPTGYTTADLPFPATAPAGVSMQHWYWASPPLPDGKRHVISAIVMDAHGVRLSKNLDAEAADYLKGARSSVPGATLTAAPTTKGLVMGQPFARIASTVSGPQVKMANVTYLGFDGGNRAVILVSSCHDPEGSETYRLLETSLLTVHQR